MKTTYQPDPSVLAHLQECHAETLRNDLNTPEQKAAFRSAIAKEMARAEERRKPQPQLDLAA